MKKYNKPSVKTLILRTQQFIAVSVAQENKTADPNLPVMAPEREWWEEAEDYWKV